MWKRLFGLLVLVLVFLFAYSWYLPSHHTKQLVLDLSTDTVRPGILVTDTLRIEQSFILQKSGNAIVVPFQAFGYSGDGVVHIAVRNTDTGESVASSDYRMRDAKNGDVSFSFPQNILAVGVPYIAELSFSGIQTTDNIRLPYAFGKYANLSGLVTQYQFKNTAWKQTDTRHGNVAMQVYSDPQEDNLLLAFKTFTLPAVAICVLWFWVVLLYRPLSRDPNLHGSPIKSGMTREYVAIGCIGLVLAGIATAPLYIHPGYISNHGDINRALVYAGIAHRDILAGHLPQWNQYICGGSPLWGDLESWFLQPLFLITLPFSEVVAMKITYTLTLFVAFVGFYAFARRILVFEKLGAGVFALVMALGGYISGHLAEGYYVWVASAWVPWFLLFAVRSMTHMKYVFSAGLMLAFMFGSGSMHLVVFSLLFIGIVFLFPLHSTKLSHRVATLILIMSSFVVLSAVKLLPALSLLTANVSREGFAPSLAQLSHMVFGRGVLQPLVGSGQVIRWAEFGAYMGYGVAVLVCLGVAMYGKRIWKNYAAYIIASVVLLCIAFTPLPITHGAISHVLDLFRMPSRVMLFGIFGFALIAGYAADALVSSRNLLSLDRGKEITFIGALVIIIFIAVDLVSNDITLFARTFTVPLPELHKETTFHRIGHAYTADGETYYRAVYIDFLENRGTNDVCRFYQTGPFTRTIDSTDPRTPDRGEVALQDSDAGTVSYVMNSRSEYTIRANVTSPTTIVINQNYYPGWVTSNHVAIQNTEGVIGIPVAPGSYNFTLRYRPYSVYWGIAISVLACVLGCAWFMRKSDRSTPDTIPQTSSPHLQ